MQYVPFCLFTKAADTTVNNTTIKTTLLDAGRGGKGIPANYLKDGAHLRVKAGGRYTNATAASLTLNLQFLTQANDLAVNFGTLAVGADLQWDFEANISFNVLGGPGAGKYSYNLQNWYETAVNVMAVSNLSLSAQLYDTTVAETMDLKAQFNAASTGNAIFCSYASIELLNN